MDIKDESYLRKNEEEQFEEKYINDDKEEGVEEDEEEESEEELLQNFDERFSFEDNKKVTEGLNEELNDIKKNLSAARKEVEQFDQIINEINQKIFEEEETLKDLREKEKRAISDQSNFYQKYQYEREKWFGGSQKMNKMFTSFELGESTEKNAREEIIRCQQKITSLKKELDTIRKKKHPTETLLEKIKAEKEKKESKIKIKNKEKQRAGKHEDSLMSSPFQTFYGGSEKLDIEVKKHYSDQMKCLEPLPKECTQLNILLVGQTGAGKSSFVNTSATALADKRRMIHVSATRRIEAESATIKLIPEELMINKDSNLTAMIFDCRGLTMTGKQPIGKKEMELIIEGHIRPFSEISDAASMVQKEDVYLKEPNIEDEMHCIVYAVKASRDEELLEEDIRQELKSLLDIMTSTSKPQFILLTNVDKVVPNNDIANLFRYPCVKRKCNEASDVTHVTPSYILPTANYTTELEPTDIKDALCLLNLYRIVSNAHDYVTRRIIEIKMKKRYAEKKEKKKQTETE